MPTILRKRPFGKRFEYITKVELDSMLSTGTARKLGGIPSYEELDAPVKEPKFEVELETETKEEPKTYETRELKAAEPTSARRRTYRKTGTPKSDG